MKHIVALVLFLFAFYCSFSQLTIKPKAGIGLSHLKRTIVPWQDNQVMKTGLHAGVAVEIPVTQTIRLQTELTYTVKGLRDTAHVFTPSLNNGQVYHKGWGFNFHYIELPVLIRVPFLHGFTLGAGPSIGYLIKADNVLGGEVVESKKANLTKFDYSLNADLSYSLKAFELGARYIHGLATVKKIGDATDPEFYFGDETIGKNRSFLFYIGYNFKL